MVERYRRFAPLSGVLFVVVMVVSAVILPNPPSSSASAGKVIAYFHNHSRAVKAQDLLLAYSGLLAIVYFTSVAGYLRRYGSQVLTTTTAVSAGLFAVGLTISAGLQASLADRPTHLSAQTAQTLNILQNDAWAVTVFAGLCGATLSMGVAMLLTKALPTWLGVVTTIVGIAAATAVASFPALLATAPLTLIIAGYVYSRLSRPDQIQLPDIPAARQSQEATPQVTARG